MAKTYTIKSPAKLNIGLRVLSKRADEYHNIETIFYPVKIYDEIRMHVSTLHPTPALPKGEGVRHKIKINVTPSSGIDDKVNICYKAVKLFMEEFKIKDKYEINIRIKKNIPIGAGLGGGSSDAASVLRLLTNYFGIASQARNDKINKIALKLGSDVPYFISQAKPAYATSRGEKLKLLPGFKIRYKILIVNPEIHISTKWGYGQLQVTGDKLQVLNKIKTFKISEKDKLVNDFEEPVFKKYPRIKAIKEKMYRYGAVFSLMSGSGSTVYGFFTPKKIKTAEKYFRSLGYKVFIG